MEHAKNSIIRIFILLVIIGNFSCSNSKVNDLQQQLQQKKQEYTRLKDDFQSAQELNDKQYEELIAIQKELSKLDSLSFTFRSIVEGRVKTSYTMQEEIDTLISKIREDIKQKSETIKDQNKKENKLRIYIEALNRQLDIKEREIDNLKEDLKKKDRIISFQGNKIVGLESTKDNLEKQVGDLESQKTKLQKDLLRIKGEAYYSIGVALENAASNIPELSGIFISGAKKDEVIRTKAELRKQSREYYKEAARLGITKH